MAEVHFILTSGAEITGVIQGDPSQVSTQISQAMTGTRPLIVSGRPEVEVTTINLVNPSAIAAVRILEEMPVPAR